MSSWGWACFVFSALNRSHVSSIKCFDCYDMTKVMLTSIKLIHSFLSYEVEGCPFDYTTIYNDESVSALPNRICNKVKKTLTSKGNSLRIVFTSDARISKSGFLASYTSYCKYPYWFLRSYNYVREFAYNCWVYIYKLVKGLHSLQPSFPHFPSLTLRSNQ